MGICATVIVAAASYLAYFYKQQTRPGQRHYRRGLDYLAARRIGEAQSEWLRGIQSDPDFAGCYEQLGDLYTQASRYNEAAACYAQATKLSPADGTLFLRLARVSRQIKNRQAGLAAAKRAVALRPSDPDALCTYGMLAGESKDRATALVALRRAHELRPENRTYFIAFVNALVDVTDMAGAERELAPYLRAHPGDARACFYMALVYNQKPRTPENVRAGLDFARRALADGETRASGYRLLAQLQMAAGRPRDALDTFLAGRERTPNSEPILQGLVVCYTHLGDERRAALVADYLQKVTVRHARIEHLNHVMGFDNQDIAAGLELARLEAEEGNRDRALMYFTQLVRQSPQDPRTRPALAAFLRQNGRTDLARRVVRPDFMP